ncbi:amidase [Aspergillus ibericus CBS 121593]|uniref:Amidase signature enzyme n=1 Tax=Aspergillus ibericus CBS 121593 TaxID=1448316 RepID=A0A395HC91_9EURO|nr:amidase signature enzyme [Aspergillus ibericus CBS 121593]RAL05256.1 amidase signature enzyme [Aspergillus ibericus CBS 121593]
MGEKGQFFHYPEVRPGPAVPYKNEDQVIPVFRGTPLAIGATLIQNVGLIQSYFWRNAGFDVIRNLPLDQYSARYDPTVIPVANPDLSLANLPIPTQKRKGNAGYYTSADYVARYESGELTPTAVVETLLPLIRRDANRPGKHSVAFLDAKAERIRAAAEASTQRYKDGRQLGPMDGIPVAVKDEVHMEGYRRTLGSKIDFTGEFGGTSWCVKKWEEAGAIVIGRTTMHELGLDTTNNNPNYGTPKNPHNPNYYCGGSSGGSAYAVGAGLVPIALGADGGGSIRIPSSFCGVWGLKPSHSRVSGSPTVSLATTVGVYGPIAASIDDLALAYRIMAAPAPTAEDPLSAAFPPPLLELAAAESRTTPRPKTIGIVRDWIDRAEPAVRVVFDAALDYYVKEQGYTSIDIKIPYLPEGQRAHVLTIMNEIASALTPDQISQLTAPNKVLVSMGMWQITGQDFLASQRLRNCLMTHLAYLFQQHPGLLILSPTTPIPGWRIEGGEADLARGVSDGKSSVRNMEYVWLANFTGCPAINCPAGYHARDGSRVPIGLMAMGEWGSEEDLIAFARDGEAILDLPGARSDDAEEQSSGLTVPRGENAVWEDVISQALERTTAATSS